MNHTVDSEVKLYDNDLDDNSGKCGSQILTKCRKDMTYVQIIKVFSEIPKTLFDHKRLGLWQISSKPHHPTH
jgi:hypothetical protein